MNRPGRDVFVLGVLLASVIANVLLTWQLRSHTAHAKAQQDGALLKVGDHVPPLKLTGPSGDVQAVGFDQDSRPTVLYVFSKSCEWCNSNRNSIRELAKARDKQFRFVAVSRDDKAPVPITPDEDLGIATYVAPTDQTRHAFAMNAVPLTMVIGADGTVLKRWNGAYVGSLHNEIQEYFDTRIPQAAFPEIPQQAANTLCRDLKGIYGQGAVTEHSGRLERCVKGAWVAI
jgi:peroxiredoxin